MYVYTLFVVILTNKLIVFYDVHNHNKNNIKIKYY